MILILQANYNSPLYNIFKSKSYFPSPILYFFSKKSRKQASTTSGSYNFPRFFLISSKAASIPKAGR